MNNDDTNISLIDFKIAILKVLYNYNKIDNEEYNNAKKIYEKELHLYQNINK